LHLLILGGSLGAQALNQAIPEMLSLLPAAERPEVFHQTGEKLFSTTQKLYESKQISANLVPFVEDMASAYNWADLVICRAGALTIAELCAAGLGAVLVPYPHAVDDHQTANAQFMVQHNAALCLQQNELTAERLRDIVKQFSQAPEQSLAMAQAAYQLRRVNVTAEIYRICQEICP
jgi:UDP-N-acetylglucosamine--N-acetylmuramyl-(pentapeptide) pyrophosphoryl-undecaprenol N-acetylglucosamine transferase